MDAATEAGIKVIFEQLSTAWQQSGGNWLLLLPWIPLALVQAYKLDVVQGLIASRWPRLAWGNLHWVAQGGLAFVIGALPVFGGQLALGVALGTAAVLASSAGAAAVLGFKPAQAVTTRVLGPAASRLSVPAASALSIILPIDPAKVDEARAKRAAEVAAKAPGGS